MSVKGANILTISVWGHTQRTSPPRGGVAKRWHYCHDCCPKNWSISPSIWCIGIVYQRDQDFDNFFIPITCSPINWSSSIFIWSIRIVIAQNQGNFISHNFWKKKLYVYKKKLTTFKTEARTKLIYFHRISDLFFEVLFCENEFIILTF